MWQFIFYCILAIATLIYFYPLRKRHIRNVRLAFIRFGEKLGAPAYVPQGHFKFPFINATYKGFPLHVRYIERGKHGKYTFFEMNTGIQDEFWFSITGDVPIIRTQDVNVGDPEFDSHFVLKTNQPRRMRMLLDPSIGLPLMGKEIDRCTEWQFKEGVLTCQVERVLTDESFAGVFEKMVQFAALLSERIVENKRQTDWNKPFGEAWPEDEEYLRKLVHYLPGGTFQEDSDTISYTCADRKRAVSFVYHPDPKQLDLVIRLRVLQKFWFRLVEQRGTRDPNDLVIGNSESDERFVIHTDQPELACTFLNAPEVSQGLSQLRFNRFEIHRGKASLRIPAASRNGFGRSHLETVLTQMNSILDFYEQQTFPVTLRVMTAVQEVCPFCRDRLAMHPTLSKCSACGTVHHADCWMENTRCTTYGCDETAARSVLSDLSSSQ